MPARTPLAPDALAAALADLPGWEVQGDRLARTFTFADFREAMAFIVRVAFEAEALDHHPELTNVYNRVTLALTTHDAGNRVTETDLALARAIAALAP
ncbi:MAG: 4a-hydroxytetrahydrobiopterin dehydratase [Rubricoccaceae bacterium]